MSEVSFYNLNGKLYPSCENTISVNDRSFRYGDGFFETMKLVDATIQLKELHFERVKKSFEVLKFQFPKHFSFDKLEQQIIELIHKNKHQKLARIRINFSRKEGELFGSELLQPNILLQSFSLNDAFSEINKNGLIIDVFEDAKKSCDKFSNIKSNNFLPYVMAAIWAKENKLNDALLLNTNNSIADSCIANLFIIKDGKIYTPPLSDGCISGVMRKNMIEKLRTTPYEIIEKSLFVKEIEEADEVFLTNAIKGISWVKQFKEKQYTCSTVNKIYSIIF